MMGRMSWSRVEEVIVLTAWGFINAAAGELITLILRQVL